MSHVLQTLTDPDEQATILSVDGVQSSQFGGGWIRQPSVVGPRQWQSPSRTGPRGVRGAEPTQGGVQVQGSARSGVPQFRRCHGPPPQPSESVASLTRGPAGVRPLRCNSFQILLLRRFRQPLPLTEHSCRSGHLLDSSGHHRSACPVAGVLGTRGFPLENEFEPGGERHGWQHEAASTVEKQGSLATPNCGTRAALWLA